MPEKKTRLAQMITAEQVKRGFTDRQASDEVGVMQQTYSAWKRGAVPRPNKRAGLAAFLRISADMMAELADEAHESLGSTKLPRMGSFDTAREYGRVVDRKEGKYKFDTSRKAVPEGRYKIPIDTKCMEPALRVGTTAWADPGVFSKPGDEVMVHTAAGFSWIGILADWETGRATIARPDGWRRELDNVVAVHTIVLAERI
jgi:transcriptional regulator with XRE-family HTH domain